MFHCTSLLLSEIFLRFICIIVSICSILNLSSVLEKAMVPQPSALAWKIQWIFQARAWKGGAW